MDTTTENITLINYSNKEINQFKNGKVIIANNSGDIKKFIRDAQTSNNNHKLYFGKINSQTASKIKILFNIDVENYNVSLKLDNVKHILKKHGNQKEYLRGQVPILESDFELIPYIISNFDTIKRGLKTAQDKPVIICMKQIRINYYLVSYVSNKHHNLEIQTMWKIKKNSATMNNISKNPIPTSENE